MARQNKLPTRKPSPQLSAEEELAEILADPTLRPSINFLGFKDFRTGTETAPDTDTGSDTALLADTVPALDAAARAYNKDTSLAASSPQTAHPVPGTVGRPSDPTPDALSVPDTEMAPVLNKSALVSVPDIDLVAAASSVPAPTSDPIFEDDIYPRRPRHQRPTARRARSVEDGHSHAEHSLYSALWERAKPYNADARIITMGFGSMSHLARLSLNNCRQNIRSLIHKLAVEEIRAELCSEKIGKTYLIYNQPAILRRRRSAGLEWVIRTKGVVFIDPRTGAVLTDRSPAKSRPVSVSDTETVSESETVHQAR